MRTDDEWPTSTRSSDSIAIARRSMRCLPIIARAGLVHFLDAFAGKPQRVDEQRADAAAGVELQRRKAFGAGYPGAQHGARDLQHPQRRRIIDG